MLGINATNGQALSGIHHLRQSLRDILTTRIGTRVMRRDYGSRLPELIDNPMTPRLAMELYSATAEALSRWEPRFKLSRVRIAQASAGRVVLDLEGTYLPAGEALVLNGLSVVEEAQPPSQMPIPDMPIEDFATGCKVIDFGNSLLAEVTPVTVDEAITDEALNRQASELNRKILLIAKALGAK